MLSLCTWHRLLVSGLLRLKGKISIAVLQCSGCKGEVEFVAVREMMCNIAEQIIAIGSFLELHPSVVSR